MLLFKFCGKPASLRPAIMRQRLPFLGLLLAAIAGIVVSHFSWWPSGIFLAGSGVSFAVWLFSPQVAVDLCGGRLCIRGAYPGRRVSRFPGSSRRWLEREGALHRHRVEWTRIPYPSARVGRGFALGVRSMELDGREFPCPAGVVVTVSIPVRARRQNPVTGISA